MRVWLDMGVAPPVLAINTWAVDFKMDGVEQRILDGIDKYRRPPGRLELEITEYTLMARSGNRGTTDLEGLARKTLG